MKFDRGGSTEECSNQAGASGEAAKMDPDINRKSRDTKTFKVLLHRRQGRQGNRVKKLWSDLAPGINIDGRLSARWKL